MTLLFASIAAVLAASHLATRRRYRQQRQRDRAEIARVHGILRDRADQLAVFSHEIRTPLSLIKGGAELLADGSAGPLTAAQEGFTATIRSNSDHLITLAEDLLIQARIEAGMFRVQLSLVDIRAVVRDIVQELRAIHPHDLVLDAPGVGRRMYVDKRLIRQAVANLVNNGARHTPHDGEIKIRVTSYNDEVIISVSDTGAGMSDEQRANLFERYASGQAPREGTGLGMIITRKIAELHGGGVHVDTMARRGTTVLMSIPNLADDGEAA